MQYEDELLQAMAQSVMPMGRLTESADKAAALSASIGEQPLRQTEDLLAQQLLAWFKYEFFTWVSHIQCHIWCCSSQIIYISLCLSCAISFDYVWHVLTLTKHESLVCQVKTG